MFAASSPPASAAEPPPARTSSGRATARLAYDAPAPSADAATARRAGITVTQPYPERTAAPPPTCEDRLLSRVDFHQHLWPEDFLAELRARRLPPRLEGDCLQLAGERTSIDLDAHRLDRRLRRLDEAGLDVGVVSLQPTLGIELLPAEEQSALAAAWQDGMRELASAADGRLVPLAADPAAPGFAGACVPASALFRLDDLAPALEALERRGAFLFVHPGTAHAPPGLPGWWSALVDYTAQMQAAYAAWVAGGVERWPRLNVVFAILAGGAPFQLERLWSRGVEERSFVHETVFFETASYGRRALELCLATFGVTQLVFGSDLPVCDPQPTLDAVLGFGDAVADTLIVTNPRHLLP